MTCLIGAFSPHVAVAAGLMRAPMTANDAAATIAAATSVLFTVLPPCGCCFAAGLPAGNETHALVHLRQGGARGGAGLVGACREQAGELVVVAAVLVVAGLDRLEERDHGLGDVCLELPVATAV